MRVSRLIVSTSFFCGILAYGSVRSLVQDYYGLEGYIQSCRDHWISAWVTVPISVLFFLIAAGGHTILLAIAQQFENDYRALVKKHVNRGKDV